MKVLVEGILFFRFGLYFFIHFWRKWCWRYVIVSLVACL